jgi:hypothetical protein
VTAAERKRAERERYRLAGLVPVQVWVKPADRPRVQQYAERLNKRAARQEGA